MRVAAALAVCAVGGAVCAWLRMPLPWMIGSMLAMASVQMAGAELEPLPGGRDAGMVAVGVTLGLYFTAPVVHEVATYWPWFVALGFAAIGFGTLSAFVLERLGRVDLATAFFASMPGGAADMALMGERRGAAPERVAVSHSIRMLLVVTLFPIGITLAGFSATEEYRPVLIAFDVLYVKGRDVSQRPLRERRARLEDLLAAADAVYSVRRLAADGLEAWAQVVERGYEGLVAKDEASAYEGGRTIRWLKVKQKGWTVEEDRWRRRISVAPSRGPKGKRTTPPLAPHQPRSARDAAHSAIDTRKPVSCGWGKTVTGIAASSTGVVRRSSAVEQAPSLPRGFTAVLPSTLRRGHGQSSRWCPPDRISTFY